MNIFRKFLNSQRQKNRRDEVERLRSLFTVEDHDGKLWLLCDGTAFAFLSDDSTTGSAVETIEGCRRAAVAHRYGLSVADDAEIDAITILETNLN